MGEDGDVVAQVDWGALGKVWVPDAGAPLRELCPEEGGTDILCASSAHTVAVLLNSKWGLGACCQLPSKILEAKFW